MANVIKDNVRIPSAAGALGTGVTLPGGGTQPARVVHCREVPVQRVKVELPSLQMLITAASGGAADAVGQKILSLPEGSWMLLASECDFTVTTPSGLSVATAVFSLGTAAATNANAALTSTEADILASTTLGDGTLAAAATETEDTVTIGIGSGAYPSLIGDNDGIDIYFNIGGTFTHASNGDHNIVVNGTVELVLIDLNVGK